MEKKCKDMHPSWAAKPQDTVYGVVLTHDLDSLLATAAYRKVYPNDPIIGFYNFKEEFRSLGNHNIQDIVYIDANMTRAKCWGNHPMLLSDEKGTPVINNQSINLNNWFGDPTARYDKKVHFSTTLHLLSYYGFDVNELTDPKALAVLMMLDGVYNTFLGNNQDWIDKDTEYLEEVLEYPELVYFMDTHPSHQYFEDIKTEFRVFHPINCNPATLKLDTHIKIKELNKLFEPWGLDLTLPTDVMKKVATYKYDAHTFNKRNAPRQDNAHSASWNSTNKMYVSTLSQIHI